MGETSFQVSRATVDDLGDLCALGKSSGIDRAFIEPHLTDFQVARSSEGSLVGAVALQLSGLHARLHSEMFTDFGISDELRGEFWERIQSIARSRGLTRVWTQETSLFWKRHGFLNAQTELKSLPDIWRGPELDGNWLSIQLRDEEALKKAIEKEFARLKEEDERANGDGMRAISTFRHVAVALAILVAAAGIAFCVYILRNLPVITRIFHR